MTPNHIVHVAIKTVNNHFIQSGYPIWTKKKNITKYGIGELVCTHHRYRECHWLYSNWFNWKFEQK